MFHTIIHTKAQTWKRTGRKITKVYMEPVLREYYYRLYWLLMDAGIQPYLPAPLELKLTVIFSFSEKRWRDLDNLLKAVCDCGQPSKWVLRKEEKLAMPDLWDDKQFAEMQGVRIRGAKHDSIEITIEELKGDTNGTNSQG